LQIEIYQREAGAQPVMVLCQAAIAHLIEAEDALHDAERMFYLGPYARLSPFLCPLKLVHSVLVSGPLAGHVLSLGSGFSNRFGLALIAAVAPYLALFAMK
jgi:hypothetical protein